MFAEHLEESGDKLYALEKSLSEARHQLAEQERELQDARGKARQGQDSLGKLVAMQNTTSAKVPIGAVSHGADLWGGVQDAEIRRLNGLLSKQCWKMAQQVGGGVNMKKISADDEIDDVASLRQA